MTTINTNATISFRSKFEKFLNDETRPIFAAAFKKFCSFSEEKALTILWQFTYKPHEVPFYFEELGLMPEQVSEEMLPVFISELRSQYKKLYPSFCEVTVPDALRETYEVFTNATSVIVSKHVYDRCTRQMYRPDEIEINLSKMVNEKAYQETRERAIKFFSFGPVEAQYLHTYRKPLHDFLEKMYELNLLPTTRPFTNTPFAALGDLINKSGMDLPFEYEEPDPKYKALTSEEVRAHKDVFTSFVKYSDFSALSQLNLLGFDLNKVMAKKDAILHFLEIAAKKEEIESDFAAASKAKEEADEAFAKASAAKKKADAHFNQIASAKKDTEANLLRATKSLNK